MATITPTNSWFSTTPPVLVTTWAGMANSGDVGAVLQYPGLGDKTVHFMGASGNTFGASLTAILQGSMTTSNFSILKDPTGANISTSSLAIFAVMQNAGYVRPNVTYGASGLAMDVIMVSRGAAK